MTRLALCSDTHLWPNANQRFGNSGAQMQPWSTEIQATLLAEITAARPDLLLHLGDMTCGGGSFLMPVATFAPTLTELVAAFRQTPAQFYGLPGNHDCPAGGDWSLAEELFGLAAGQGSTIDTPSARLVLLHTQGHPAAVIAAAAPGDPCHGWVSPAELARVEQALATAGQRPVLLFCHQLLRPWVAEQPWADLYGIHNGAEVLALLQRYGNVRAVFQAHAHRLDVQHTLLGNHPCWFVVIPAVIEYPMAWLELTLSRDQVQVQMRRLPLLDLAQQSLHSGGGDWRAGRPEWRNFVIPFS